MYSFDLTDEEKEHHYSKLCQEAEEKLAEIKTNENNNFSENEKKDEETVQHKAISQKPSIQETVCSPRIENFFIRFMVSCYILTEVV